MAKAGVAYIDVDGNFNPFNQGLSGVLSGLSSKFGAMGGVGTKALAGVGLSAVAVGVGLFKVGEQFDHAFDTIRVGTGAIGAQLTGLEDDFKAVVKDIPTDFGTAATAIADLNTRLGLTGPNLQEVAKQVLELSRLTNTDLATNIRGITRFFGDWSVATDDQSAVLDKLFRASQATGIGVAELTDKVVFFGAPLRQLGFSMDQAIAMVSKFEKEGVNLETVLGGMRMGLARLAKAGEEPAATFKRVVAEIKNLGDSGDIIASNSKAIELFGSRAGPDVAAAIREGRLEVGDLIKTIAGGKDTILGAAADTESFSEKWLMFKNKVLVALQPIASKFFDSMGTALDVILPIVGVLVSGFEKLAPVLTPIIIGFVAFGTVLLPVLGIAKGFLKLVSAIKAVGSAFQAIGAIFAANPWVLAIIGLIILAALIVKHWDEIKAFLLKTWHAIEDALGAAWDWIKSTTSAAWTWIKAFFKKWWPLILGIFTGGIGLIVGLIIKNWSAIKKWTTEAWENIKTFFAKWWPVIFAIFTGGLSLLVGLIVNNFTAIKDFIVNTFNNVVAFLAGIPGAILGVLSSIPGLLWGLFQSAVDLVWGAVSSGFDNVVGFIASIPGRILGALGDLGDLLFNAGAAILQGFLDGLESLWGDVEDFFGGLSDIIPDWKGPLDRDRVMLVPAGQAIMGGLIAGSAGELPKVKRFFSQTVPATITAGGTLGPATFGVERTANGNDAATKREVHLHLHGPISIRSDDDIVQLRRGLAREVERQDRAQGKTG